MVAKMSEQTAVKQNHQLSIKRKMLSYYVDQKMGKDYREKYLKKYKPQH